MRWLAALIVLASLDASARPRRDDDFYYDRELYKPPKPCKRTANWTKHARCQFKTLDNVTMLHDLPGAKLVAYDAGADGRRRLELYLMSSGAWVKSGFYAETNPSAELLDFAALPDDTYRIDMGYANATHVTLDEVGSRPAMLRRQYTHFCSITHGCRTAHTSCDVLVHGRTVATFRGTAMSNGGTVQILGDSRATNRYCVKPAGLVETSK
jgi:hypothetical protein